MPHKWLHFSTALLHHYWSLPEWTGLPTTVHNKKGGGTREHCWTKGSNHSNNRVELVLFKDSLFLISYSGQPKIFFPTIHGKTYLFHLQLSIIFFHICQKPSFKWQVDYIIGNNFSSIFVNVNQHVLIMFQHDVNFMLMAPAVCISVHL